MKTILLGWLVLMMGTTAFGYTPDGGDIPLPLMETNQRAELADGEQYTLVGTILAEQDQVYLEVNFEEHPWLRSARRARNPYYPIGPIDGGWEKFTGKSIQIQVMARGFIVLNGTKGRYGIWLTPLKLPILVKR
jgi:hypothetical protein